MTLHNAAVSVHMKENPTYFLGQICVSFLTCDSKDEDEKPQETKGKFASRTATERGSKFSNLKTKIVEAHSSLPRSITKHGDEATSIQLEKMISCKSLCELELEEVKGFMDLGFVFDTENMSKRMMSVLPGLQRLELGKKEDQNGLSDDFSSSVLYDDGNEMGIGEKEVEENGKRKIRRPYLSEAWLIKRSDSPLVNLGTPSVCSGADMKKHVKYWAKNVASAIQKHSC